MMHLYSESGKGGRRVFVSPGLSWSLEAKPALPSGDTAAGSPALASTPSTGHLFLVASQAPPIDVVLLPGRNTTIFQIHHLLVHVCPRNPDPSVLHEHFHAVHKRKITQQVTWWLAGSWSPTGMWLYFSVRSPIWSLIVQQPQRGWEEDQEATGKEEARGGSVNVLLGPAMRCTEAQTELCL